MNIFGTHGQFTRETDEMNIKPEGLLEIANAELAKAIEYANRADDLYQATLDYFKVGRWDRKPTNRHIEEALQSKISADRAMHDAFEKCRALERACV